MFVRINEVYAASCAYFLRDSYALCGKINITMRNVR